MYFIYKYEWLFFFLSETLIWLLIIPFLIIRYRYGLDRLSYVVLLLMLTSNLFQGLLVGVDYYYTGKVSFFQMVIVVFFLYACTLGKSDFIRIDQYIKQKYKPYRSSNQEALQSYMTTRRNFMILHTAAFFILHQIWFAIDEGRVSFQLSILFFHEWIELPHEGFYKHPMMNAISYFWKVIYYFDLIVYLILCGLWQLVRRGR